MILGKTLRKNAVITVLTMFVELFNSYILISYLKYMVGVQLVPEFQVPGSKRYSDSDLLTSVQLYLQFSHVKLKSEAERCHLCPDVAVFL